MAAAHGCAGAKSSAEAGPAGRGFPQVSHHPDPLPPLPLHLPSQLLHHRLARTDRREHAARGGDDGASLRVHDTRRRDLRAHLPPARPLWVRRFFALCVRAAAADAARWADDETTHAHMRAKVHQNMTECAAIIERHYLQGPWVLGDRYSMCDPYLALVTRWLGDDDVEVAQFPKIAAHNQAMRARPSMQTILRLHT